MNRLPMLWPRRLLLPLAVLFAVCFGSISTARAEPRSIREFVSFEDKWPNLEGPVWNLEGRVATMSSNSLRYTNCSLPFVIPPGLPRPRLARSVEVTGKITTQDGKLVFLVASIQDSPSDEALLRLKRGEIDSTDAGDWYRVAEWARLRGEFYEDQKLLDESRDLLQQGILTEYRKLDGSDPQGLAKLLKKAESLEIDQRIVQRIRHEELRRRFEAVRKPPFQDDAYLQLLGAIGETLPGARTPLDAWPAKLAKQYTDQPNAMFVEATDDERKTLGRLFYLQVMVDRITREAQAKNFTDFQIADRLRAETPERTDLIEQYESAGLKKKTDDIASLSQLQLIELTQRLQRAGKSKQANSVKRQWLQAREPAMRLQGARGLSDLAALYETLVSDEDTARQFYIQAWQLNSEYAPPKEWLQAHGYQVSAGQWMLASEIQAKPKTPIELAIEEGRLELGMTGEQVRFALGSAPDRNTRLVTRGALTEIWIYEGAGIMVRLSRVTGEKESHVKSFEALTAPVN